MTATAVAEERAIQQAMPSTSTGRTSGETARSLSTGSSSITNAPELAASPLATRAAPTQTPALEESMTPDGDTPAAETEGDTEGTVKVSETPAEEATPTRTPTPEPTATPMPVIEEVNTEFAAEFLALLNAQRTGRGLDALRMNVILTTGATEYAGYMGTHGFFGHDAPDGSDAETRARLTGYSGAWNGEALSAGQPAPQAALYALLASPARAAILLDPRSAEIGIGYAFVSGSRYLHYWVVMTGIP